MSRESDPSVASPCTSVCVMDSITGLCGGCFRTLTEIAGWIDLSFTEKREVVAALAARRSIFGAAIETRFGDGTAQPIGEPMDDSAER
jgi:uncharacterized protein